jgi:5'-nucleotidase
MASLTAETKEGKSGANKLRILHFNDVYNVDPTAKGNVCGGAARFVHLVNSYQKGGENYDESYGSPLVFFSGDAFNPSMMSTITKGAQMVPVLNALNLTAACYGNHDFDFGVDTLLKLRNKCTFPWFISNVKVRATGKQLADGEISQIFTHPETGLRIGIMGLVESEWMATLATVEEEDIEYTDFVQVGRALAKELRSQGADIIVGMTHMREPNDRRLAKEAGDVIDIILGGHDHHYWVGATEPHGIHLCKSGTDFHDLTVANCLFTKDPINYGNTSTGSTSERGKFQVDSTEHVEVTRDMPENEHLVSVLKPYQNEVSGNMLKIIGETAVPLDCSFKSIRTRETAISNFIADCVTHSMENSKVDMCLINAGTLRADRIIQPGTLTTGDLVALLPMLDPMVVLELNATQLLEVLENGVSQWPALEGRFPCVSGVTFDFKTSAPSGSRVVKESVLVRGKTLAEHGEDAMFTLCTKQYLSKGKDGYNVFADCKIIIDEEELAPLGTMVRRFFLELSVLNQFRKPLSRNCVFSNKMVRRIKERFIFMKKSKSSDGISKMADQCTENEKKTSSGGSSVGEVSGTNDSSKRDNGAALRIGSSDRWNPRTRVHGSGSTVGRTSPPPRNDSAPPAQFSLPSNVMQIHPKIEGRIKALD